MKIIVDADACPVIQIVEDIAKEKEIPVTLVCDTAHFFQAGYSKVVTVDKGADSADFKIVVLAQKGDIVVTQDYGVASMCLGKGVFPIHQSGKWYTVENIDQMMFERHIAGVVRRKSKKNHLKGPKKRNAEDDKCFAKSLQKLVEKLKGEGV